VPQSLIALDMAVGPAEEAVIVGASDAAATATLLAALRSRFRPRSMTALRPATARQPAAGPWPLDGLFAGRTAAGNDATLYLCRGGSCQEPLSGDAALAAVRGPG
jgi:uncharacterized protein YyaL (SSP411 family)